MLAGTSHRKAQYSHRRYLLLETFPLKNHAHSRFYYLAALASAFSQYCDVLLQVKSSYWVQSVIGRLNAALGDEAHILIKIIPKLSSVLDTYTSISDNPMGVHTWVQNSQHAIQR